MKNRLRAGIIGLGVGETHIQAYVNEGVEVVALCDFNQEKLAGVAARHPTIKKLFSNSRDLLTDSDIDIVSIASYDDFHCEEVVLGLANRKHIFVEKPICLSPIEAAKIRESMALNPNQKVASNLILRCSPRFQRFKKLISDGNLGLVYHIEGDYLYGRIGKVTEGWRGKTLGYSVTLGGGVHLVDLMVWLLGERVVEVKAIGGRIATRSAKLVFPDTVTALLTFESGATGKLSANFPCVHPHFHKLSVYGTQATLENAVDCAKMYQQRDSEKFIEIEDSYLPKGKHLLLAEFIREIQEMDNKSISIDEVFQAISICFAIDEAVSTGKTVTVKYL